MTVSPHAAAAASVAHAHAGSTFNPAQQAKAADPAVKGADFGALVAQFAKAQHAPATGSANATLDPTAA
jgi:hypothetical protein